MNTTYENHHIFEQYVKAREFIINKGFGQEIDWQYGLTFSETGETDFLREGAWVILSSGMREAVVRSIFPQLSAAFLDFRSASEIANQAEDCHAAALDIFSHRKKIDSILSLSVRVVIDGFERVRNATRDFGVTYLQSFDYIGPATSYHFAKNLGLEVAKPDRHLTRVAAASGYKSVDELCESISLLSGDPIAVVDLVIWRFATLRRDYQQWFQEI